MKIKRLSSRSLSPSPSEPESWSRGLLPSTSGTAHCPERETSLTHRIVENTQGHCCAPGPTGSGISACPLVPRSTPTEHQLSRQHRHLTVLLPAGPPAETAEPRGGQKGEESYHQCPLPCSLPLHYYQLD